MLTLDASAVTVEYDWAKGRDAVLIVPFPAGPDASESSVRFVGSVDDLRGLIDTMERLVADLADS